MNKKCPECGDSVKGRIDKRFCSDMCRNAHNNRIKGSQSRYYRNVNSTLRRNYRILEELIPEETIKASKARLLQKGFNFGYYTNVLTTRKGAQYYYCNEYGYLPLENDYFLLVKKKEGAE